MGNFIQRAKNTCLFFTGVLAQHYVEHLLNSKTIESEKKAQELRDQDRKSTRLNSSHSGESRMPSSA